MILLSFWKLNCTAPWRAEIMFASSIFPTLYQDCISQVGGREIGRGVLSPERL